MAVSKSAFYGWLNHKPSNREMENKVLRDKVSREFVLNKGNYGRRRIAAVINQEEGFLKASINRVDRRMKDLKIAGYTPPSFKRTTIADPLLEDSPNLVTDAAAKGINEIWVCDLTYVATSQGWLFLCVIIDLYSRKVIGWSTRPDMKVDIVLDAFDKAVKARKLKNGAIFHCDKGGQFKSKKFRRRLQRRGFRQSMTGINHCYDNAVAESFFGTLKTELIRGKKFTSREAAEAAIFEYIEVYYNRLRLHSTLGYKTPDAFEQKIA